jgi:hypothetical protein
MLTALSGRRQEERGLYARRRRVPPRRRVPHGPTALLGPGNLAGASAARWGQAPRWLRGLAKARRFPGAEALTRPTQEVRRCAPDRWGRGAGRMRRQTGAPAGDAKGGVSARERPGPGGASSPELTWPAPRRGRAAPVEPASLSPVHAGKAGRHLGPRRGTRVCLRGRRNPAVSRRGPWGFGGRLGTGPTPRLEMVVRGAGRIARGRCVATRAGATSSRRVLR